MASGNTAQFGLIYTIAESLMKSISKYSLLLLLILTKISFSQNITNTTSKTMLQTIANKKILYDSVKQVLIQVDVDDQKYRNEMDQVQEKYGGNSKEMKDLFKNMGIADSLNLIIVEKIIDKYGWLGADEIGNQANTALFMVIQHNNLKTQEKYLPVIREAVRNGKAKASDLALLEDRVALQEGRSQIYGSQLSWDLKTNTYIILPIVDPDNLDKRRAAVGLIAYADYLKGLNIMWNLEQYKKELPEIERQFKLKK